LPPVDGPVLARDDRKRAGAWYTPPDLAARVVDRALELADPPVRTLLDPFCGAGAFLEAAAGRGIALHGVDRDPAAVAACRAAVPEALVAVGDSIAGAPPVSLYDAVVGNPPWEVVERSVFAPNGADRAELRRCGYLFIAPGSKLNLYRLALERGFDLLRPGGILAFLVPAGFLRDSGGAPLRRHFLDAGALEEVTSGRELFPSAHRDLPVCAIFVRKGGPTRRIALAGATLSREAVERFSPDQLAIPALSRAGDADLLGRLLAWPRLETCVRGLRKGDVNLATDRAWFRDRPTGLILRTGKEISPGRLAAPPSRWVATAALSSRDFRPWEHERVVWRDIADVTLKKRMCACVVPPFTVLGDTLDFLVPPHDGDEAGYWQAVLNSHAFEWLVRLRSAHNHLGVRIVGSCPVPPWEAKNRLCQAIATAGPIEADALVARRYGLSGADFAAMLGAFPKQPADLKARLLAVGRGHQQGGMRDHRNR
jgi:SAM-dependent methyltransferase